MARRTVRRLQLGLHDTNQKPTTTSKKGSRRANYPIPTRGGSLQSFCTVANAQEQLQDSPVRQTARH